MIDKDDLGFHPTRVQQQRRLMKYAIGEYIKEFNNAQHSANMQFNNIQAWMEAGKVVVLRPNLPMETFLYEPGGRLSKSNEPDHELMQRALA